mmetsp:Transcript_65709/g.181431  ORF Transcript_65709/g.181431 Transcript_65709/m.181431 type:complete len:177 (-) Transcript_65709:281-811(-)
MYSTKQFNSLSSTFTRDKVGFIAEKEPYSDKPAIKMSRHKGKQFQTVPPKNTMDGGGYFDKATYTKGEEYVDKLGYLKTQPLEARKLGFGSHDASNRDEFTSHIRTEQYRELLVAETAHTTIGGKEEEEESDDEGVSFSETSAADIGRGVSDVELAKPTFGRVATTHSFYNRGHLG